jgi:hypothetical protein
MGPSSLQLRDLLQQQSGGTSTDVLGQLPCLPNYFGAQLAAVDAFRNKIQSKSWALRGRSFLRNVCVNEHIRQRSIQHRPCCINHACRNNFTKTRHCDRCSTKW